MESECLHEARFCPFRSLLASSIFALPGAEMRRRVPAVEFEGGAVVRARCDHALDESLLAPFELAEPLGRRDRPLEFNRKVSCSGFRRTEPSAQSKARR